YEDVLTLVNAVTVIYRDQTTRWKSLVNCCEFTDVMQFRKSVSTTRVSPIVGVKIEKVDLIGVQKGAKECLTVFTHALHSGYLRSSDFN
ncbi:hypothetical protein C1Y11_29195, partial [Pseudomonas sp. FW305-20]